MLLGGQASARPLVRQLSGRATPARLPLSLNAPFLPDDRPRIPRLAAEALSTKTRRFLVSRTCGPTATPTGQRLASRSPACARKRRPVHNADGLSPIFEFLPGVEGLPRRQTHRARDGPHHHRRRLRRPEAPRHSFDPGSARRTSTSTTTLAIPATRTLESIDAESPATAQVLSRSSRR